MLYDNVTRKYIAAQYAINKTRQIVILYDGVISLINQAIEAINNNDIQERYNLLEKAITIINGLQDSLDHVNGGNIAKLLDDYYFSIYMRMMSVQMVDNKNMLENIANELIIMRDAWLEVDEKTCAEVSDAEGGTTNEQDGLKNGGGLQYSV
jgi:flagellar protein FliS